MNPKRILFRAAMVADADRVQAAPGAVLFEAQRIIAAGSPQSIGLSGNCEMIDLPRSVIVPGLVNAHSHLDLSHIGPRPFPGDFVPWVDELRARRALADADIDRSVRRGIELARDGGTALIGDIAGISSLQPIRSLREQSMPGVSYLELFGLGGHQSLAIERIRMAQEQCPAFQNGVALGLQPHAPYSCGIDVYRAAADTRLPLATHLAETLDEITFVQSAAGPLAQMLQRIGVWDEAITGHACHPIDHLMPLLSQTPFVAAHLNYVDDAHLDALTRVPITVAYCPRASAYFGHRDHRYRDMLERGINVALGTDSIICLDTPDRLSVLDDMRFLFRRDEVDPLILLRMATVNGAKGLRFDPALVTLAPGKTLGLLAIDHVRDDPLRDMLQHDRPPRWICGPFNAHRQ